MAKDQSHSNKRETEKRKQQKQKEKEERRAARQANAGSGQGLDDMIKVPGHAFAVLHVDPLGRHLPSPPLDGPEVKFRFGRYLERTGGRPVFDVPLHPK